MTAFLDSLAAKEIVLKTKAGKERGDFQDKQKGLSRHRLTP